MTINNKYVLITGASSGIGLEMARQLASKSLNLILVARSASRLHDIAEDFRKKFGIDVLVCEADLSIEEEVTRLYKEVTDSGAIVDHLVNNAGSGLYGNFLETDLDAELKMISLNVTAVIALTKLFGRDMAARGSGRIMNIASLLSFLPFPYYSVYSASKAFILAFSETLAAELEGTGVVVTTLCPGPVDTPFATNDMLATNAYKANRPMAPEKVAAAGVELLLNRRGKRIPGFNNWFISNLPRVTPDFLMIRIKKMLATKS